MNIFLLDVNFTVGRRASSSILKVTVLWDRCKRSSRMHKHTRDTCEHLKIHHTTYFYYSSSILCVGMCVRECVRALWVCVLYTVSWLSLHIKTVHSNTKMHLSRPKSVYLRMPSSCFGVDNDEVKLLSWALCCGKEHNFLLPPTHFVALGSAC